MSLKNVEKFFVLVKNNENIAKELIKIKDKLQQKDKIFDEAQFVKDEIISLAQKNGIDFTPEEFLNYVRAQISELSDEDLIDVSGGGSFQNFLLGGLLVALSSVAPAVGISSFPLVEPISQKTNQNSETSSQTSQSGGDGEETSAKAKTDSQKDKSSEKKADSRKKSSKKANRNAATSKTQSNSANRPRLSSRRGAAQNGNVASAGLQSDAENLNQPQLSTPTNVSSGPSVSTGSEISQNNSVKSFTSEPQNKPTPNIKTDVVTPAPAPAPVVNPINKNGPTHTPPNVTPINNKTSPEPAPVPEPVVNPNNKATPEPAPNPVPAPQPNIKPEPAPQPVVVNPELDELSTEKFEELANYLKSNFDVSDFEKAEVDIETENSLVEFLCNSKVTKNGVFIHDTYVKDNIAKTLIDFGMQKYGFILEENKTKFTPYLDTVKPVNNKVEPKPDVYVEWTAERARALANYLRNNFSLGTFNEAVLDSETENSLKDFLYNSEVTKKGTFIRGVKIDNEDAAVLFNYGKQRYNFALGTNENIRDDVVKVLIANKDPESFVNFAESMGYDGLNILENLVKIWREMKSNYEYTEYPQLRGDVYNSASQFISKAKKLIKAKNSVNKKNKDVIHDNEAPVVNSSFRWQRTIYWASKFVAYAALAYLDCTYGNVIYNTVKAYVVSLFNNSVPLSEMFSKTVTYIKNLFSSNNVDAPQLSANITANSISNAAENMTKAANGMFLKNPGETVKIVKNTFDAAANSTNPGAIASTISEGVKIAANTLTQQGVQAAGSGAANLASTAAQGALNSFAEVGKNSFSTQKIDAPGLALVQYGKNVIKGVGNAIGSLGGQALDKVKSMLNTTANTEPFTVPKLPIENLTYTTKINPFPVTKLPIENLTYSIKINPFAENSISGLGAIDLASTAGKDGLNSLVKIGESSFETGGPINVAKEVVDSPLAFNYVPLNMIKEAGNAIGSLGGQVLDKGENIVKSVYETLTENVGNTSLQKGRSLNQFDENLISTNSSLNMPGTSLISSIKNFLIDNKISVVAIAGLCVLGGVLYWGYNHFKGAPAQAQVPDANPGDPPPAAGAAGIVANPGGPLPAAGAAAQPQGANENSEGQPKNLDGGGGNDENLDGQPENNDNAEVNDENEKPAAPNLHDGKGSEEEEASDRHTSDHSSSDSDDDDNSGKPKRPKIAAAKVNTENDDDNSASEGEENNDTSDKEGSTNNVETPSDLEQKEDKKSKNNDLKSGTEAEGAPEGAATTITNEEKVQGENQEEINAEEKAEQTEENKAESDNDTKEENEANTKSADAVDPLTANIVDGGWTSDAVVTFVNRFNEEFEKSRQRDPSLMKDTMDIDNQADENLKNIVRLVQIDSNGKATINNEEIPRESFIEVFDLAHDCGIEYICQDNNSSSEIIKSAWINDERTPEADVKRLKELWGKGVNKMPQFIKEKFIERIAGSGLEDDEPLVDDKAPGSAANIIIDDAQEDNANEENPVSAEEDRGDPENANEIENSESKIKDASEEQKVDAENNKENSEEHMPIIPVEAQEAKLENSKNEEISSDIDKTKSADGGNEETANSNKNQNENVNTENQKGGEAQDVTENQESKETKDAAESPNQDILENGYCGSKGHERDLKFTLYKTGELVISANEDLINSNDFVGELSDSTPFNSMSDENKAKVTTVTIKDGVKEVKSSNNCNSCFNKLKENIKKITIEGDTKIGNFAFNYLKALESFSIKGNPTQIGQSAFANCYQLSNISVPKTVTVIGKRAFSACRSLAKINIPDSVTNIEEGAFGNCEKLVEIIIPDSVKTIGPFAFSNCFALNHVKMPKSINNIANGMFNFCTALENIDIPNSVKVIGDSAFSYTKLSSLTIPESVTTIGNSAFSHTKLLSLTIPKSVTTIREYAFLGCENLETVIYEGLSNPAKKENNPNEREYLFHHLEGFDSSPIKTKIFVPSSYKDNSFGHVRNLVRVGRQLNDNDSGPGPGRPGFGSDSDNDSKDNHNDKTDKAQSENNKKSESDATEGSGEEQNKNVNAENQESKETTSTNDNVEKSEKDENIEDEGFCGNFSVNNGENVKWTLYKDGQLKIYGNGPMANYEKTNSTPWFGHIGIIKSIVISGKVSSIGNLAFSGCSCVDSISMPESVTSIGSAAFYSCTSIKSIAIPNSVTSIGDNAFYECTSLESIDIPSNVKSIGSGAFQSCTSLSNVKLAEGLVSIGSFAFSYCESLKDITIPGSVTSIGEHAFSYCSNLDTVTYDGEYNPAKAESEDYSKYGGDNTYEEGNADGQSNKYYDEFPSTIDNMVVDSLPPSDPDDTLVNLFTPPKPREVPVVPMIYVKSNYKSKYFGNISLELSRVSPNFKTPPTPRKGYTTPTKSSETSYNIENSEGVAITPLAGILQSTDPKDENKNIAKKITFSGSSSSDEEKANKEVNDDVTQDKAELPETSGEQIYNVEEGEELSPDDENIWRQITENMLKEEGSTNDGKETSEENNNDSVSTIKNKENYSESTASSDFEQKEDEKPSDKNNNDSTTTNNTEKMSDDSVSDLASNESEREEVYTIPEDPDVKDTKNTAKNAKKAHSNIMGDKKSPNLSNLDSDKGFSDSASDSVGSENDESNQVGDVGDVGDAESKRNFFKGKTPEISQKVLDNAKTNNTEETADDNVSDLGSSSSENENNESNQVGDVESKGNFPEDYEWTYEKVEKLYKNLSQLNKVRSTNTVVEPNEDQKEEARSFYDKVSIDFSSKSQSITPIYTIDKVSIEDRGMIDVFQNSRHYSRRYFNPDASDLIKEALNVMEFSEDAECLCANTKSHFGEVDGRGAIKIFFDTLISIKENGLPKDYPLSAKNCFDNYLKGIQMKIGKNTLEEIKEYYLKL